ncbi:MAG TPA: NAD-dependent epimerase/dehydratase family protein [Deltaproteobacteria bacterium]|nr:NAD-dependent epimerase/dehydratase family protein [Deltaproteobacteria bacterium]
MIQDNFIINGHDTVLITGAGGFIGIKVVETLLEYGFRKLRCLVRSNRNLTQLQNMGSATHADVEVYQGNLLSRDDCRNIVKDVSVIYHLAAGIDKTYPGCFLNSVVATRNLLDAAIIEPNLKRFVNISSIAVYSNEHIKRGGLLDESCPLDDRLLERFEPYTYGKAKQDALLLDYAKKHDLPYVIVRPSVVFGPGKAKITDRIGSDTFGIFLHLGLNNIIPLTYVDNCAEAVVLAGLTEGIEGQVFNIVDDDLPRSREFLNLYRNKVRYLIAIPVPYSAWYLFNYLWEKYSSWSHGQLPPVFNRRSCAVYWKGNRYSNRKAKELLGWQPRVPMNEALDRFITFMRDRG